MLPEVETNIAESPVPRSAPPSTTNFFVAGATVRGPVGVPVLVTSIGRKIAALGPRTADTAYLHDALDVFFREGGRTAYVSRAVGAGADTADAVIEDFAGDPAFNVSAAAPGAFGNDIDVETIGGSTAGSGEAADSAFSFEVSFQDTVVEVTPQFETKADAVSWFEENSSYARLEATGHDSPAAGTVALAGGVDDNNLTAAKIRDALAAFTPDLGPGQVAAPGLTAADVQGAVIEHGEALKRTPWLDGPDTATVSDITAAAVARRSVTGHQRAAMLVPWDRAPGDTPGTKRTVPPCGRAAALHARIRANGGGVGDPVAGEGLPAQYVNGLSQPAWSDADRETLNDAGVCVSRIIGGQVVLYGNRTLTSAVDEPQWAQLSQARVITSLAAEGRDIGRAYVHSKADGRGHTVGEAIGRLQLLCKRYYDRDDLYGDTPAEAYSVIPATEVSDASATLVAVIEAKTSPGFDRVRIDIYKAPAA